MPEKKRSKDFGNKLVLTLVVLFSFFGMLYVARYTGNTPTGPEVISIISNTTGNITAAQMINLSGGYIYTVLINVTSQNPHWKAFVGNVSGKITLDNSNNYTIYDWTLTFTGGTIFATRISGTVNWTRINCTWGVTYNNTNRTVEGRENAFLNLTSPDDNISATFSTRNHTAFYVGTIQMYSNYCYSIFTYVNDTSQATKFQEVLLYDGANLTDGNLIYASVLENDALGYDKKYYDFQMIVPDRGLTAFTSMTAYYIYVELG